MSAQNDFPTTRQIAYSVFAAFVEVLGLFGLRFTVFLAGLMAYLSWQYLPPHIGFVVVVLVILALVADEIAEARRA